MKYLNKVYNILGEEGVIKFCEKLLDRIYIMVGSYFSANIKSIYYRIKYGESAPSQYKIIHVSPNEIEYMVVPSFYTNHLFGTTIKEGVWDQNFNSDLLTRWEPTLIKLDDYNYYRSIVEFLEYGKKWSETESANHQRRNGSREKIERIYRRIIEEGYMSQKDLKENNNNNDFIYGPYPPPEHYEVAISIGRNGKLFFEEGQHRFFIAKVLNLEKIPVRVIARHKDWQEIRALVASADTIDEISHLPNNISTHPDLQDLLPKKRN